jgi:hypothetical protein
LPAAAEMPCNVARTSVGKLSAASTYVVVLGPALVKKNDSA